jgi:hypothetical protein
MFPLKPLSPIRNLAQGDNVTAFGNRNFPISHYLAIPQVSSERRRYIPIIIVEEDTSDSWSAKLKLPRGS